ncbi:MAG: S4 domain-containing protein [Pseudomonadota bacterium]|nr:S4 domain-containing protein [Pseudomonadota bacterium]
MNTDAPDRIRLDKWLWAARFFKTRAVATDAVKGGKVHVNDQRVKPSHPIKVDDRLVITKGALIFEVCVRGLTDRRGPAKQAALLYEETPMSIRRREEAAAVSRAERVSRPLPPNGRPDKRARRHLIRLKSDQ